MDSRPGRRRVALPVTLTIAGSDSGGGAGIQADLRVFNALGAFGTCAITCVTAQNPDGVRRVDAIAPAGVAAQIAAVCDGFPVAAAKTGMLYSVEIIRAVVRELGRRNIRPLVADPVMVATSGAHLLRPDAVCALRDRLFPLATVITPNVPEAERLWERPIRTVADMAAAARAIGERAGTACLVKGGHLAGRGVVDVLYADGEIEEMRGPRVRARETHGTGCTFAAALTARLAHGAPLRVAAREAKAYVAAALAGARRAGRHWPLGTGRPAAGGGS